MTLIEELRSKKSRDNRELLDRAADRIEELERELACATIPRAENGITFRMNKDGTWEKYEPYMTIDCPTEEDFEYLKAALEKQHKEPVVIVDEQDREFLDYCCPRCKVTLQQKLKAAKNATVHKSKYCDECGQALDWTGGADHE